MSRLANVANLMEKYSDWFNPILVKENRQSLKSRQFVVTFMLLLLVSWIITVGVTWLQYDQMEYGRVGPTFVIAYYWVLGVAVFIVVPYGAYRSLMAERDENTSELLTITALSPSRIVWGKLFSALLQLFIYYSAISPFIAFTSLLEGFEQFQVMYALVWSMVLSLVLSTFMMMLSLNARQRHWQALSTLFAFGLLVFAFFTITSIFSSVIGSTVAYDSLEFWLWNAFAFVIAVSYAVLFQQITAAQLTHESGNRSTRIRIVASIQFLMVLATIGGLTIYLPSTTGYGEMFVTLFVLLFVHWGVVTLFVSTEHDYLSRRIRRDLPKRRLWRRALIPFLPGGAFGLVYSALHLLALIALVIFTTGYHTYGSILRVNPEAFFALACYYVIFASIGTFLVRVGNHISGEFRPAHARIITVLFVVFCTIAPLFPRIFSDYLRYSQYEFYDIINPTFTVSYLAGDNYSNPAFTRDTVLYLLIVGAIIAVLSNLGAFRRAAKTVLHAEETLPEYLSSENIFDVVEENADESPPMTEKAANVQPENV